MVFNRDEVVLRALAAKTNGYGLCQQWTRETIGVNSVGDYDGDGAADAEDGWKSEPASYRHTDRNPPPGVPVSYGGGSHDNGHRAISLGNGMIRSTDAGGAGKVATVGLDWPEKAWGLKYLGWSDTCDGVLIPMPPPPPVPNVPPTRGSKIDEALDALRASKGKGKRGQKIKAAIAAVRRIGRIN